MLSAIISQAIAVVSTLKISISWLSSSDLAIFLSLVLPFFTGYILLRTPGKLWILEINIRNQLKDLETEIELKAKRGADINIDELENRFLSIMKKANEKRVEVKEK